jgi:hypothetical protein
MFNEVVKAEVAAQEVGRWLDHKSILPKQREMNQDSIDTLAEAVRYGLLSIDADSFEMEQKLLIPVEDKDGNVAIDKLNYKARVRTEEINKRMKGQSMDLGLISVYGAALTGKSIGEINKLDTSDGKILRAIVVFFM